MVVRRYAQAKPHDEGTERDGIATRLYFASGRPLNPARMGGDRGFRATEKLATLDAPLSSRKQNSDDRDMRSFTTTGPIVPDEHYSIPPLERMDLDYILRLIRGKKYFILHAPRQTGKTSALLALANLLNGGSLGSYRCLYINVESAQIAREDVASAVTAVVDEIAMSAHDNLADESIEEICTAVLALNRPHTALKRVLSRWARADPRPLVLLIDEIDSLVGASLLTLLRQLRSGYHLRPRGFPHSVILCGVRDLLDYRIHASGEKEPVTGGSAFNISADSLRLGDFSQEEVLALLGQHTVETGQAFLPDAVQHIWDQTCGQPWLVNALCRQACFPSGGLGDPSRPIAKTDIREAQEHLILRRVTHLDQLVARLPEKRVQRVIEPLLSGNNHPAEPLKDYERRQDLEYVRDLGLISPDDPPRFANPIYAEAVPRELTIAAQGDLPVQPAWYVDTANGLQMTRLMEGFQDFFRQHSEHWLGRFDYEEAGPQLLLQTYLQRVLNSGGRIEREAGLGRGRTDLLVTWPLENREQRFVVECKILRGSLEAVINKGLNQTAKYVDARVAEEGHLVIFDREKRLWKDRVFRQSEIVHGTPITVWGM